MEEGRRLRKVREARGTFKFVGLHSFMGLNFIAISGSIGRYLNSKHWRCVHRHFRRHRNGLRNFGVRVLVLQVPQDTKSAERRRRLQQVHEEREHEERQQLRLHGRAD